MRSYLQQFKIRCSKINDIMGGAINKPTEKQLARLEELENKPKKTDKQFEELQELIAKRDSPNPLSVGAKTYCKMWLKEQVYGKKKEFSNKYTEKGTQCEDSAIKLKARVHDLGFIAKNEQFFENEYITGTPDLILAESVEDIKNSWDIFTFPLFEVELPNPEYFSQLQGYMDLTGKRIGGVNYCLIDAPEEFIDREARNVSYKAGFSEVEAELYDEVYAKMAYGDVPDSLKLKRFQVVYDHIYIQAVYNRVEMCREYINSLIQTL